MILESKSFYWSIYSGLEETLEGEILVGVLVLEHPSPTRFRLLNSCKFTRNASLTNPKVNQAFYFLFKFNNTFIDI